MIWQTWLTCAVMVPVAVVELYRWRERVSDRKAFDARMAKMKADHEAWMAAHGRGTR